MARNIGSRLHKFGGLGPNGAFHTIQSLKLISNWRLWYSIAICIHVVLHACRKKLAEFNLEAHHQTAQFYSPPKYPALRYLCFHRDNY